MDTNGMTENDIRHAQRALKRAERQLEEERARELGPLDAELAAAELDEVKERGRLDAAIDRAEAVRVRHGAVAATFATRRAELNAERERLGPDVPHV